MYKSKWSHNARNMAKERNITKAEAQNILEKKHELKMKSQELTLSCQGRASALVPPAALTRQSNEAPQPSSSQTPSPQPITPPRPMINEGFS